MRWVTDELIWSFFLDSLGYKLEKAGFLSAAPYLAMGMKNFENSEYHLKNAIPRNTINAMWIAKGIASMLFLGIVSK